MPIISHMGVDYDSPNVQIQDNASATDLDNTKVPTGQTIKSYINKITVKTHSFSLTTNGNGIADIPTSVCKPSTQILLAVYCGSGAYGYIKYDSVANDKYALCVVNLTTSGYTRIANTSLTLTIEYIDMPFSSNSNNLQTILSKTVTADCGSNGVVSLNLNKNNAIVVGCSTPNADLCYPVCHNNYGWYAAVENWAGTRKTNTSCTVTAYYLQI